jgi:glycosyltransferase involved in cell wall biosynthesis
MIVKRLGGRGGLQVQARRVARAMLARGVRVTLIGHERRRGSRRAAWMEQLPSLAITAPDRFTFAARLFSYLCNHRDSYDVVHVHGFDLEVFAAIAARRITGKPLVVKPSTAGRKTKLDAYGRWGRRAPWLFRNWRGVDAWVSISSETRENLLEMGVSGDRIVSIPNGVDPELFYVPSAAEKREKRAELGVPEDDIVVMTVARLTPHKRVDVLIRCFQELLPACPNARLWIAGIGEEEARLRELAAPTGDRIKLWGGLAAKEVPELLRSADIFSLLSLWEGLPNALLEAMACGLAPVVTGVSGSSDVVEHQVSGLLVPPDDESATRAALQRVLTSAALRQELGAAATQVVRERYDLNVTVTRLLDLYAACLSGRTAPAAGFSSTADA